MANQRVSQVHAGKLRVLLHGYAPPPIPIHAVYLNPRMTSAKVRTFIEHLRENFSKTNFLQ
jgi:DNA-binding transcriptional LysR family regulator